jgi:hypothetical protein
MSPAMREPAGRPDDERRARGPGARWLGAVLVAVIASIALVGSLFMRNASRSRQAEFAGVCTSVVSGTAHGDVEAAFLTIGEASSGWGGLAGEPPSEHDWVRHTGLAHYQQCTVYVEPSTQRVRRVVLDEGSSFDHCTSPITYPRRHWLCRLASALDP